MCSHPSSPTDPCSILSAYRTTSDHRPHTTVYGFTSTRSRTVLCCVGARVRLHVRTSIYLSKAADGPIRAAPHSYPPPLLLHSCVKSASAFSTNAFMPIFWSCAARVGGERRVSVVTVHVHMRSACAVRVRCVCGACAVRVWCNVQCTWACLCSACAAQRACACACACARACTPALRRWSRRARARGEGPRPGTWVAKGGDTTSTNVGT